MLQAPLLSTRLNPLTLTVTPLTVNVRMFPAVPEVAEFPSKMKVPGEHGWASALVSCGVASLGSGVGVGAMRPLLGCGGPYVAWGDGTPGQPLNMSL